MASAAGTLLVDSSGNIQLDSSGNIRVSDGVTDDCCCGPPPAPSCVTTFDLTGTNEASVTTTSLTASVVTGLSQIYFWMPAIDMTIPRQGFFLMVQTSGTLTLVSTASVLQKIQAIVNNNATPAICVGPSTSGTASVAAGDFAQFILSADCVDQTANPGQLNFTTTCASGCPDPGVNPNIFVDLSGVNGTFPGGLVTCDGSEFSNPYNYDMNSANGAGDGNYCLSSAGGQSFGTSWGCANGKRVNIFGPMWDTQKCTYRIGLWYSVNSGTYPGPVLTWPTLNWGTGTQPIFIAWFFGGTSGDPTGTYTSAANGTIVVSL